jgi:hypothetical protein
VKAHRSLWSAEEIQHLADLVEGASPVRAAAALGRRMISIQNMARKIGKPFADVRKVKRERLAREDGQRSTIETLFRPARPVRRVDP